MSKAAVELPQTRTDRILAAITLELDRYRDDLDSDEHLRAVNFAIKVYPRTGEVRTVILTRETERSS